MRKKFLMNPKNNEIKFQDDCIKNVGEDRSGLKFQKWSFLGNRNLSTLTVITCIFNISKCDYFG